MVTRTPAHMSRLMGHLLARLSRGWAAAVLAVVCLGLAYTVHDHLTTTWDDRVISGYADRFGMPDMLGGSPEEFILGGVNRACGLMTQDPDIPRTFDRLVDFGYSSDQSTFFIAAGAAHRCTEFKPLFERAG